MNGFDAAILHWFNQFARRSYAFDAAVVYLSDASILKGEAMMALVWWLWFARRTNRDTAREVVIATLVASLAALVLYRALDLGGMFSGVIPFRVRPVVNPDFHFVRPYTFETLGFTRYWSAYPSDHAMLFSAIATGLLFASWPLGLIAHAYWVIMIGVPRIYIGLHHPTDILGGAVIGGAVAVMFNVPRFRRALARFPLWLHDRRGGLFYAAFFLVTVQFGTMFKDAMTLGGVIVRTVRWVRAGPPPAVPPAGAELPAGGDVRPGTPPP